MKFQFSNDIALMVSNKDNVREFFKKIGFDSAELGEDTTKIENNSTFNLYLTDGEPLSVVFEFLVDDVKLASKRC